MPDSLIHYPKDSNVAIVEGNFLPIGQRSVSPSEILEQLKSVVRLPYEGKDTDKIGMTLLEAALYSAVKKASDGDLDALEKVLNRLMGKPIQQVANLSMTTTLKDFLDGIARTDGLNTIENPFGD